MDSERPREIDENMLEKSLRKAPDFFRDYGTYLLLGVVVLAAGWWWYNTRANAQAAQRQNSSQALMNLVRTVDQAEQTAVTAAFLPADALAERQGDLTAEFDQYAAIATDGADAGVRSQVLRLRGDFAWTMATLPESSSPASTQPSTQPAPATRPAGEWLDDAGAAYQQVVDQYPNRTADNLAALFGLAAVAEQEHRFDDAGGFYDKLIARGDLGEATRNIARQRKALLPLLGVDPRLVAAKVPEPATQPAGIGDLLRMMPEPASRPATEPAATQPGD